MVQWVNDPALPLQWLGLLWHGFDPWPWDFHRKKEGRKEERKEGRKKERERKEGRKKERSKQASY